MIILLNYNFERKLRIIHPLFNYNIYLKQGTDTSRLKHFNEFMRKQNVKQQIIWLQIQYNPNIATMIESLKYLWKTIAQQISDEYTIIREIAQYYRDDMKEKMETRQKMTQIKSIMSKAQTYKEWKSISEQYDKLPIVQQQINQVYSPYYDYEYLQQLVKCLVEAREEGDILKLIQILRSHSDRNIANANCSLLYRHAYNRSKKLIQQYYEEIGKGYEAIIKADIPQDKKRQFFGEVRHAVGRSALLLSGGAIMGMYHIGVVQALIEADCLPKIIAGSSAGSIIASILATHTKEQLFENGLFNFSAFANKKRMSLFQQFRRAGRQGTVLDIKVLEDFLKDNIGQYTFQQAYDKFSVILNITVTGLSQHDPDRLLNYLTAPNVLIWSASAASCAIPYIYGATDLYCKDHNGNIKKYTLMNRKFLDGSIGQDLPMNKLSILFNVNNFIVSQTNPWVVPFMDYTQDLKSLHNPILQPIALLSHRFKEFFLSQLKHRASQIAFIFPNAITKFLNLVTQSYVGDITIWPKPKFSDYLRILQNPTSFEAILNFVHGGRQRAYPKIHHIRSTMFLQKQIERCYRRIRNNSRLQFLKSFKDIQDAGQEQHLLKTVFSRNKEWKAPEDEDSFPQNEVFVKQKISRVKVTGQFDLIKQEDQKDTQYANKKIVKNPMRRNQSYLLPRENSFQ